MFTVMYPQQLHINPTFANVYLAQTAKFTCFASGYNVSYQWTIGSGSFRSKVTGINSKILVIPNVGLFDENTYSCVASNEGGYALSEIARLTVIGMHDNYDINGTNTLYCYNYRFTTCNCDTIHSNCGSDTQYHFISYSYRYEGQEI